MKIIFLMTVMVDVFFQDFQLVFDFLARSFSSMARYVLIATVEEADLDGRDFDD